MMLKVIFVALTIFVVVVTGADDKLEEKLNVIENFVKSLEDKVKKLEAENSVLSSKNEANAKRIQTLEKLVSSQTNRNSKRIPVTSAVEVAFHANVHGNIPLAHNQVIPFSSVTLNLGSAFDGQKSVFESPTAGYYVFFVHFLTLPQKTLESQIIKNGQTIQNVYAGERSGIYGPGSNLVITYLDPGDQVWVKVHDHYHTTDGSNLDGPWCTFAGFLLYPQV